MPVIPALGKLSQEDQELEASLSYRAETLSQKKQTKKARRK
jgi:hypothetical protein